MLQQFNKGMLFCKANHSAETKILRLYILHLHLQLHGGLAQLARAFAWHARGRRFDPVTLHSFKVPKGAFLFLTPDEFKSLKYFHLFDN